MTGRLEGRNAIVTGAASGIGRGIALKLAEEGADVVVADIAEEPAVEEKPTHELVQERGQSSRFIQTDISSEEQVKDMVYQAAEFLDGVDVLVNNAGVHHAAPVHEESLEEWRSLLEINLDGYFLCSKHVLQHMVEEDVDGDIVNIGSIAGVVGFGGSAAYCASKGAVVELTREMALDYGPEGINVNAVDPGVIRTSMTKDMLNDDEQRQFMDSNTVAPRFGKPEDIANAVAFLASEEADFVLGENLVVDGGWTAK
jgi:NAD(P)-dependent dehydrogenase (short-subunit alcohol dehydrogenase family)